jgi:transcriptional regulator with XRE-family HTH domain
MTLGEYIEDRRRALGLTQTAFADRADLDRSYVSHIEAGSRSLTAASIVAVAAALDVPVATLTELAAAFERGRSSPVVSVR